MLKLAETKSVLKMCFSKHCHEVTRFLSWIGTYCISCVVQQRIRVNDLSLIVGYDESQVKYDLLKVSKAYSH